VRVRALAPGTTDGRLPSSRRFRPPRATRWTGKPDLAGVSSASRQERRDGLADAFAGRPGQLLAEGVFDEAEVALAKAAATARGQMHERGQ